MYPQQTQKRFVPDVVGKRIGGIARGDFLIDGAMNDEDLGPLELRFDDGSALTLFLLSESGSVAFAELERTGDGIPGESCSWPRVNLADHRMFSEAVGLCIESVQSLLSSIRSRKDPVVSGYVFRLSHGHLLSYCNEGNFSKIYFDLIPIREEHFVLELHPH